jgi:uncharacterized protein (DUF983 family)
VSESPEDREQRRATGNGVPVILVCGTVAIMGFFAANRAMSVIDWVLCALVLALTIGGGLALTRLIRANPGAIGEARFDTSHGDDPAQWN